MAESRLSEPEHVDKRWFSVTISTGPTVLAKKFVWGLGAQTVGSLIEEHFGEKLQNMVIAQIEGSCWDKASGVGQAQGIGSVPTEMNADMLLEDIGQFNIKFIKVFVKKNDIDSQSETGTSTPHDGLQLLMALGRSYNELPPERAPHNAKDKLYNMVRGKMKEFNVGFRPAQVGDIGIQIVTTITNALWYLEPCRERFAKRSIELPKPFDSDDFIGFRDLKAQHKRMPMIKADELQNIMDELAKILMYPWFMNQKFQKFRVAVNGLHDAIKKYHSFLTAQQQRSHDNHHSADNVRSVNDNFMFEIREKLLETLPQIYAKLELELETKSMYEPLNLFPFLPSDYTEKRRYLAQLKLTFPITILTYRHGNYVGNIYYVWKIPENIEDRSSCKEVQIFNDVRPQFPTYATRTMVKDFIQLYSKSTKTKPALLRNMYQYLTKQQLTHETTDQSHVDERVCHFLLEGDDPALMYDLRCSNGRPKDASFDAFWNAAQQYLDSVSAVHERRHTEVGYMPFALSVEDFREQVLSTLPPDTPAPSTSWIRLNFHPANPYTKSAVCYTGKFSVHYSVQQRLLRSQHEDSGYAFHILTLMKYMAVRYKQYCIMQCLDDKATVPIGNPGLPISTGVRAHHKGLVAEGQGLLSLDHDFHVCGIVPSVCMLVEIPESPQDSFHKGEIHVTLKEKIFQKSTPIRHATETLKIMRNIASEDGVMPILLRYTDGGPDHRTTYFSVKIASLLEFVALDLDIMISARTAPNQSYCNPAERVMALLNLGLQNVSLARARGPENFECKMRSLSSMSQIRKAAERNEDIERELSNSMAVPLNILKERFSRLKRGDTRVTVHEAADQDEIDDLMGLLNTISGGDVSQDMDKLKKNKAIQSFMETHCQERHYVFQIKKCSSMDCGYCQSHPPRLPPDIFQDLNYLPDPVLKEGNVYMDFDEVYGTRTTGKDRPSLNSKPEATEADKLHKGLFVAGKVRDFIICSECGKRRVVYCAKSLSIDQARQLRLCQEELIYTCGDSLFHSGPHKDTVVVRGGINCGSSIEVTYYAGVTAKFQDICFYCGDTEVFVDDRIRQLEKDWGTVRPICESCLQRGKAPATRNAVKLRNKSKNK